MVIRPEGGGGQQRGLQLVPGDLNRVRGGLRRRRSEQETGGGESGGSEEPGAERH
jgi:hypothetical protein